VVSETANIGAAVRSKPSAKFPDKLAAQRRLKPAPSELN